MRTMETAIIFSDLHAPYYDKKAWHALVCAAKRLKPRWIVAAGDILDCYSISKFAKDPKRRQTSLSDEVACVRGLLEEIGQHAKYCHYISGNHEDRLRRSVWQYAPELSGAVRSMPDLLGLDDIGWQYTDYGDAVELGDLLVTHDIGKCGIYSLRQTHIQAWRQIAIGHSHRLGLHTYHGKAAVSCGWLGDYDAIDYRHQIDCRAEWCHGFAVARITKSGLAHLTPVAIVNGSAVIGGQACR
jgi:hypothetical protein